MQCSGLRIAETARRDDTLAGANWALEVTFLSDKDASVGVGEGEGGAEKENWELKGGWLFG